ncbi:UDP-N-acetylglucosamine--dolichyl-phosphate N-acetylglucosaminyltransferase [uncultured archaeon]|nr:UDP-N-acetylglucosamine--dolichyl-phosphate N-acetylglucosaminyltransferase [uncultured archaeon]
MGLTYLKLKLNYGRNILMKTNPVLSIIIPVFNEEKNIPLVAEKFSESLKNQNVEILLVEDSGSTDNTREEIKKVMKKYPFIKGVFINERGYGKSIFEGLNSAKGEFLCWTHADMQTDPSDTIKALEIIQKQKNPEKSYVKGNRHRRPFFDKFFEFGMSIFESAILGTYLYDINAQPNLFHKSLLNLMKNPPTDFSFDLYVYYLAKKSKYKIVRFPVLFPKRIHGESKWNSGDFKSKYKFIKRTIKFSLGLKKILRRGKNVNN